jgi:hypothetical protein
MPPGYVAAFHMARFTFKHQPVVRYDGNNKVEPLLPLTDAERQEWLGKVGRDNLDFAGPLISDELAGGIARGEVNPLTGQPFAAAPPQPAAAHPGPSPVGGKKRGRDNKGRGKGKVDRGPFFNGTVTKALSKRLWSPAAEAVRVSASGVHWSAKSKSSAENVEAKKKKEDDAAVAGRRARSSKKDKTWFCKEFKEQKDPQGTGALWGAGKTPIWKAAEAHEEEKAKADKAAAAKKARTAARSKQKKEYKLPRTSTVRAYPNGQQKQEVSKVLFVSYSII